MTTINKRVPGAESGRKLLSVLLSFSVDRPLWTAAELAQELTMPQSMVYRYLALLRETGLVDSAGGKSYRVTDRAHSLAEAARVARDPLAETSVDVMVRLRDLIDETVLVSRRSGWFSYCVERVESRQPVRLQFERGQAMSLHRGSMSRILLSGMSEADREAYFSRVTGSVDRDANPSLSDEALDELRLVGVTESFEEVDEGIWGAAAAITVDGEIVAAIGTASPIYRTDEAQRTETVRLILAAAREISAQLGSKRP